MLFLQETHQSEHSKIKLRGYCLVSDTPDICCIYGGWPSGNRTGKELTQPGEFPIIEIQETSIINVYKPQRSMF